MEKSNLKEEFEQEVEKAKSSLAFSPEYRRKKLIAYAIRTVLAIILFYVFWEHTWVRWSVLLYIPLNLFGLAAIWGWSPFLNKKIERTRKKIEEMERKIGEGE